jgi:hypothetical protein
MAPDSSYSQVQRAWSWEKISSAFLSERLFFHEGEDCYFDGSDGGSEMEDCSCFSVFELFFFIGVAKKREKSSFYAKGGLDYVRDKFFPSFRICVV